MMERGPISSTALGYDAHGRKLTLFSQRQPDGTAQHAIRVEPRDFREQSQTIEGLTDETLRRLGEVAGGAR